MEILETNRGGKKVLFEGYCYTRLKTGKSSIFWRCDQEYVMECKGSLTTTVDFSRPQAKRPHNHLPDANRCNVLKAKANMKKRALSSSDKPERIFQDATRAIDECGRYALVNKESYKRFIQRTRKKEKRGGNENASESPLRKDKKRKELKLTLKRKDEKWYGPQHNIMVKQEVVEVLPNTCYDELLVKTVLS